MKKTNRSKAWRIGRVATSKQQKITQILKKINFTRLASAQGLSYHRKPTPVSLGSSISALKSRAQTTSSGSMTAKNTCNPFAATIRRRKSRRNEKIIRLYNI